ncbi:MULTISPECIES: glycosyltransferase family 4 protein [Empedobacter]|uniref:glycosyltransferase family 4 protein n=1 Tax=Empedobacter TaxID=59734 RepID=UPI002576284E|nr:MULTISPECIES: glycosyltransferase family 4 protein [Empedobacter]MDM1040621.1 glycosyltransferase family 4 protein [Empedobacter brevis]MDM1135604.1 glycosyltransferase family 4 protein [Empedobacter sp. R750]
MKNQTKTIAILTYGTHKPLGTFSKGYIEDLPYNKLTLFGGLIPFLKLGTPLWKQKIIRYIITLLALNNPEKIESLKAKRLEKLLLKYNVDCCLAEFLNTGASVKAIAEKCNIPLISNVLGYEINDSRYYEKFKQKYIELSDYQSFTIPVARDMVPKLIELGFKKDTIIYSPIGPSEDFLKLNPNYNSSQFIFIGRMTETKSPINLIKAFEMVVKVFPQAKLVMAGDGELMTKVKDLIIELNLQKNVILPGWITKEQQKKYYEESFCYVQHSVMSSTGDKEGTPVSILEASAAGLPIISTLHAGIPDVILNRESGLLVEEHDIATMSKFMLELYGNRELSKKLGIKGKEIVSQNFSLKKHLEIVESLINKTTNNHPS